MAGTRSSADPGVVTRSRTRTSGVAEAPSPTKKRQAAAKTKADASTSTRAADVDVDADDADASLDAFDPETRRAVDQLLAAVPDASALSSPNPRVAEAARRALSALYKHSLRAATNPNSNGAPSSNAAASALPPGVLPELHAGPGFDVEQIWLQLDAAATPLLKRAGRLLRSAGDVESLLTPDAEEALGELLGDGSDDGSSSSDDEGGSDDDEGGDDGVRPTDSASDDDDEEEASESEEEERSEGGESESGESDDDDGDDGVGRLGEKKNESADKKKKSADKKPPLRPTEDRFLRLDDMEAFLRDAEEAQARDEDDDEDDEEDDDDGVDLGRKGKGEAGKRDLGSARYADFFGEEEEGGSSSGGEEDEESDDGEEDEGDDEDDDDGSDERGGELGSDGRGGEVGRAPETPGVKDQAPTSAHERRLAKVRARVAAAEAAALSEKPWHLAGEVTASSRPVNSALEVDLEFERAAPPPPPPSAEATADVEGAILRRIAEGRFDDPPRFSAPSASELKSKGPAADAAAEIDDRAPAKGLGELYEQEFLDAAARRKASGTAEGGADVPAIDDGHERTRAEARAVARALFSRLDALCHMRHAPDLGPGAAEDDVDEEAIRRATDVGRLGAGDVPALAAEEALPLAASSADARTPAEIWSPTEGGKKAARAAPAAADAERGDAKRARRARKRAGAAEKRARAAQAPTTPLAAGRKSVAAEEAARGGKKKKGSAAAPSAPQIDYSKSGAVFAELQARKEADAAAGGKKRKAEGEGGGGGASSSALKL